MAITPIMMSKWIEYNEQVMSSVGTSMTKCNVAVNGSEKDFAMCRMVIVKDTLLHIKATWRSLNSCN